MFSRTSQPQTPRVFRSVSLNAVLALLLVTAALLPAVGARAGALTEAQQKCLAQAHRLERNGWIYLHIAGEPADRGFQHGYLLANEIAEGLRVARVAWAHESALKWSWLIDHSTRLFSSRIDAESLAEIRGMADGMKAAGQVVTVEDLIAYNGMIELSEYWWPMELKKMRDDAAARPVRQSCSAFVATGSMTRDGNVVLGHNTMMDYWGTFPNVIADIVPAHGHRILWQTQPGWIHSGTDFFITDAGLVGTETTIGGFEGFDTNGVPEFVRMRRATQDAGSIEEWCTIMRNGNNGGYANAWLLGDINTREIARLELGLKEVAFEKKRDGYFIGSNVAEDPRILIYETNTKDEDIRVSSIARRVRWKQLMKEHVGRIDLGLAKELEADHFDSFHQRVEPGSRSLCGHYELEREPGNGWPGVPFGCAGTVDGKVVDATMARKLSFAARWGCACGRAFDAHHYLQAHPQFDWMQDILKSRPSQPWTLFTAGE